VACGANCDDFYGFAIALLQRDPLAFRFEKLQKILMASGTLPGSLTSMPAIRGLKLWDTRSWAKRGLLE
jgi:hypothetical protein